MERNWNRLQWLALAGGLALVLASLPLWAAGEPEVVKKEVVKIVVADAAGAAETVTADDLADLAPGESREIVTDSGKRVVITRQEEGHGFRVEVDGKELDSPGVHKKVVIVTSGGEGEGTSEKIVHWTGREGEATGAAEAHAMAMVSGQPGTVVFIGGDEAGAGGHAMHWVSKEGGEAEAHAAAMAAGEPGRAFFFHGPGGEAATIGRVIAGLESAPEFQSLDRAAREQVLALLRAQQEKAGEAKHIEVHVVREGDDEKEE